MSEETTGANGVANVKEISGSAQSAGTVYKFNGHQQPTRTPKDDLIKISLSL